MAHILGPGNGLKKTIMPNEMYHTILVAGIILYVLGSTDALSREIAFSDYSVPDAIMSHIVEATYKTLRLHSL